MRLVKDEKYVNNVPGGCLEPLSTPLRDKRDDKIFGPVLFELNKKKKKFTYLLLKAENLYNHCQMYSKNILLYQFTCKLTSFTDGTAI